MFSLLLFLSYVFFSPFYTPNVCIAHPRSSESGYASKHIPETAEKGTTNAQFHCNWEVRGAAASKALQQLAQIAYDFEPFLYFINFYSFFDTRV